MTMVSKATLERSPAAIASIIDHTNVDPAATTTDIDRLCAEVREYGFRSAVVVPYHIPRVAEAVGDIANVVPVIGFPYGVQNAAAKCAELDPILPDIDEVDMVIDRTALANGDHDRIVEDIRTVNDHIGDRPLKCIIETPALEPDAIRTAAELVEQAGAQYVKTAVGYAGPTSPEDVRTIAAAVGEDTKIKASGGIGSFDDALTMVEAGAAVIGASSSVEIVASAPT